MLLPNSSYAQTNWDCGATEATCEDAVDPAGNSQGCKEECGPCTFYFYCQPQIFNPVAPVVASLGCSVYWECPELEDEIRIYLDGQDEGINSGGNQTDIGNWYATNWSNNQNGTIRTGWFNWGPPGIQQYVYITLTTLSGEEICNTSYFYNCY